ncbi:MAG: hypothetical protein ACKOVA_13895 [Novosphingobium sp.]
MTNWKTALRGYLAHGGRVLVEPTGALSESGGIPRWFNDSDLPENATAIAAHRAYFGLRDPAARARIKRAALMLGRRVDNGWRVLEART